MRSAWLLVCFVLSFFCLIDCQIASAAIEEGQQARTAKGKPAATFTPEQCRRLRERDGCKTELAQLRGAGKFAEALSLSEKMLRIDREIFGPDHPLVGQSLAQTVELHVRLHDFSAAKD